MKIFIKSLKIILIAIGVLFVADFAFVLIMANWQPEVGKSDAVIVLGAAINTPALTNRTLVGLDLFIKGKADEMILSGGKIADSDISEAQFMEKVIMRNSADRITYILEDKSRTTYENIKNSKAILDNEHQKELAEGCNLCTDNSTITIVSDKFHLARAFLIAKRAGFKTVYWTSPRPDYYSRADLDYYYFREFVAIIDYIPKFIFG